jgi:hypothetical protein
MGSLGIPRGGRETPQSGCGCIVLGVVVALLFIIGLFWVGSYAVNTLEDGWHVK